jgi:D-alanine-D-alanine ligase
MIIGITYDLREDYAREGYDEEETAEFDHIDTVTAIELALRSLGHATDRIGRARALIHRLDQGDRWDLVFNIAEGMHGFGRQALVPALLDAHDIPYTFSDPLTLSLTLHKGMAKHAVRGQGIPTPDFKIISGLADIDDMELAFPLFVKPVAEGTSKGIGTASKVHDGSELRSCCMRLLARFHQPVLVETFLPGREFTVGVLGTGSSSYALGVMELELREEAEPEIYSYANKKYSGRRVRFSLAADAAGAAATQIALDVWRGLGCRDGGRVDLRCDAAGRVNFLEVNPLAGLNPTESDLVILAQLKGVPYVELIGRIVALALGRAAARPALRKDSVVVPHGVPPPG